MSDFSSEKGTQQTLQKSDLSYKMPYETLEEAARSRKLEETKRQLSQSGFYYGQFSHDQSVELLKNSKIGTFIVRNSSSIVAPFTISLQTCQGPTSLRIHYQAGKFFTDVSENSLNDKMVKFDSLFDLINCFKNRGFQWSLKSVKCAGYLVLMDQNGKIYPKLFLHLPFKKVPSSLMHLARLAVNTNHNSQEIPKLQIPTSLKKYLQAYPHSV